MRRSASPVASSSSSSQAALGFCRRSPVKRSPRPEHRQEVEELEALRAGASGFLLKDTPREDLVEAIRVVAGGDALLAPSITRRVIEELTAPELEMQRYVARGLSNAEIAKQAFVSETTVKTHVARILLKLRLRDRVQAVVFAYETGLITPGEKGIL